MEPYVSATKVACRGYLDPSHETYIDPAVGRADLIGDGIWGGTLYPKLDKMVLAAVGMDDAACRDRLIDVVRTLTTDAEPARATILNDSEILKVFDSPERPLIAAQAGLLPVVLDALRDILPASLAAEARDYLRRAVVEPFKGYLLEEGRLRQLSLGINLAWWDFQAGVWSLAVAFDESDPSDVQAFEMIADLVRRGLHMGVDEQGVIGEGPFYGNIDMAAWLTTAEVLTRFGVCDLWSEEPLIRRMARMRLYYALPGFRGLLDHCDASRHIAAYYTVAPLLLAGTRLEEPALQLLWQRLAGGEIPLPSAHGPMGVLAPWLWLDPDAGEPKFDLDRWPHASGGGRWGVSFTRTGWGDDDLFFSLYAAGRDPGTFIHQQTDAGHFALAAMGEVFCTGRGYGHSAARYQNVLIPGGEEPTEAPGPVGHMWRGGSLKAFEHGRHADYIAVDTAWQWQSQWNLRYAMVVRAPGAEPYVLLLDNCNQASDWLTWEWTMQLEDGHELTIDQPGLRATVQGKQHRLELAWSHFRESDFDKPHRLELLTDRTPAPARKDLDMSGGLGYRRLIGRLEGYNGVMLAAMMPHRADAPAVGVTQISGRYQFGFQLDHGDVLDTVVAAPIDRRITIADVDGEATLAVIRRDREGKVIYAGAAESYALTMGGRVLQRRQGLMARLFEADLRRHIEQIA